MEPIDVAITFDIERDTSIEAVMPKIIRLFERYDAVGTWFLKHDYTDQFTEYTGAVVEDFPDIARALADVGEIGTHIHFRDVDGTFSMAPNLQRDLLEQATESLRSRGYDATSFRGGNLCADTTTLNILEDLDYAVDSSVLPGHYRELPDGVVVDHRGEVGNRPYRPAQESHTTHGDRALLEVPVSGLSPLDSISVDRSLTGVYNRAADHRPLDRLLPPMYHLWGWMSRAPIVLLFHDHEFGTDDGSLVVLERFLHSVATSPWFQFATVGDIAAGRRSGSQ
ncbi:polysaccharide deacetylase family protein [Haloarcula amylolytica]|uniref:NodB homology domain-containing protein n=1 Tax=Haloarcula amylolytica JCM 13557 TaxID=1227452 RepID=M0K3E1_9EURY|nr:polysaccharide deacetylase family protein [Haloarcula amylolytica]EMA15952.1 hypothetical protein C442_18459 [Haloarcula amylolytica JCM 13557]